MPKTPVRPNVLSAYLDGYDPEKAAYLINVFSEGFRIESEGLEGECLMVDNTRLPEHLRPVLERKLQKEIEAGRILGPFDDAPFPNLRVSPIKVAPKKTPGDFRFIHNLSYPYDEEAVNTSIPRLRVSVQYSTLDDAISHIKEVGMGAHLAKTDIKLAFRIVPIHPDDHHLLGMRWNGGFYYDTTLPMGCSMSCAIFESFSTAIQWIANNKLGIPRMVHVLDNFLMIASSTGEVSTQLRKFLDFCEECGIPIAPENTEGPDQKLAFLGITLDVTLSLAILPDDKLSRCRRLLREAMTRKTMTLKELQSLLGHLNFACRVVVPGRAFLRRVYALTQKVQKHYHHVKITKEVRADFETWYHCLSEYNGRTSFLLDAVHTERALQLYNYSSKTIGYGAVLGTEWLYGTWREDWKAYDITFLELYPIVLSSILWGGRFSNRTIEFYTDNLALVSIINKCSSRKTHIMLLVRALVKSMLRFNFVFYAIHIPGVLNVLADALSRDQIGLFRSLHKEAVALPLYVPEHLTSGNSWLK